eukprot:TRINITY_DN5141_c0_g2_i2.p1 TRINITY_DN5141_c0_g2~~TRINITY_DN5141_c0_g2_i2.p1  ORF type:complete len:475 (-),score=94.82 TRINITY_DN5141_c0_g2_i2:717-2141(-)
MIQVALLLLLLVISYIAYLLFKLNKANVKSLPFFTFFYAGGNLPEISYNHMVNNKIEGFFQMFMGTKTNYLATDPDSAQFVLSSAKESFPKFSFATVPSLKYVFDDNLVTVNGEQWKRQRLVFNPAFNHAAYEQYYPKFSEVTDKAIKILAQMSDGGKKDVDFAPVSQRFTLDVLGRSIFNYDFQTLDGKIDHFYEAYKQVLNFDKFRLFMFVFPWLDYFSFIPHVSRLHQGILDLEVLFKKVVNEHKETEGLDILGNMMKATESDSKAHLSKHEFDSNLFILFVAGHETTANALSWALYELAKNPDIQQRLYDEIESVLQGRHPTLEELSKLVYLEAFISEVMRRHPPVLQLATRKSTTDLKYKDQVIPGGCQVGVNIYNVHHHPAHWEDPFKFNPDRFLKDEKRHRYAFLPFSLGSRMCIGNNFSLIEQHLFITRLLQTFVVSLPKEHELKGIRKRGLNTPENIWVSFKPRK